MIVKRQFINIIYQHVGGILRTASGHDIDITKYLEATDNTCNSDKLIAYGFLLFVTTILLFLVYHIYCKRKFGEYNPSLGGVYGEVWLMF